MHLKTIYPYNVLSVNNWVGKPEPWDASQELLSLHSCAIQTNKSYLQCLLNISHAYVYFSSSVLLPAKLATIFS